jgi:hypothetical protein
LGDELARYGGGFEVWDGESGDMRARGERKGLEDECRVWARKRKGEEKLGNNIKETETHQSNGLHDKHIATHRNKVRHRTVPLN